MEAGVLGFWRAQSAHLHLKVCALPASVNPLTEADVLRCLPPLIDLQKNKKSLSQRAQSSPPSLHPCCRAVRPHPRHRHHRRCRRRPTGRRICPHVAGSARPPPSEGHAPSSERPALARSTAAASLAGPVVNLFLEAVIFQPPR
jgi:hypothetical protein